MQIGFQGANWVLNQDTVNVIAKYNSLFIDSPELSNFIYGFLWLDKVQSVQTYFWVIISIWSLLKIGGCYAVILLAFAIYCISFFLPKHNDDFVLTKKTKEFYLAMILFFTHHRIKVYMTPKKGFLIIVVLLFISLVLPKIVAAFLFPIIISSLLIQTENLVDYMNIIIIQKKN